MELSPILRLVVAIITAYYYAFLTKGVITLRRLRVTVIDLFCWQTWGINGKVRPIKNKIERSFFSSEMCSD